MLFRLAITATNTSFKLVRLFTWLNLAGMEKAFFEWAVVASAGS